MDPSFKLVNNNQAGSNPNVMPKFELRGASSIPDVRSEYEGDPNMPVFIVDGFETVSYTHLGRGFESRFSLTF